LVDLLSGIEESMKESSKEELKRYHDLRSVVEERFKDQMTFRRRTTLRIGSLTAIFMGMLVLCVGYLFIVQDAYLLALGAIPILCTAVFVSLVYILGSTKCCLHKSLSASDPKTWLGIILPSVPPGGYLKLVLGSLCPYGLSADWLLNGFMWLKKKKNATIQIVSGIPDLEMMKNDYPDKLNEWVAFWRKIKRLGLDNNIHLLPERSELQFVVTNNIARIEKDHKSWLEREEGVAVPNHIHLFDFLLVKALRNKFNRMWSYSIPVESSHLPTIVKEYDGSIVNGANNNS
jgi:hypothetical protein